MRSYAYKFVLGVLAAGCADAEIVPTTVITVGDSSIRMEEDGSASVELFAESNAEALIYEIVDAPKLGQLVGSGTTYEYVPTADVNGSDTFTWKAIAEDGTESSVATVLATIESVNDAPTGAPSQVGTQEDTPVMGTLSATDVESDPLTWILVAAPEFGRVDVGTDGRFTYTPDRDFVGIDSFLWSAIDPQGATTGPVRVDVNVTEQNDPPVIGQTSFTVTEDTPFNGQLSAIDPDGDRITWNRVSNPSRGTLDFNSSLGTFTYRPNLNVSGTDSFVVNASDGVASSPDATINLTITAVNDRPVVASVSLAGVEDTALNGTVVSSDVENDARTFRIGQPPRLGTVSIDPISGGFTYVPNRDRNGLDDFTVIANDGQVDSLPGRISIQVAPVNDAPTLISAGLLTTLEDTAVSGQVAGIDVEGDTLTFGVATPPANGSVTLSSSTGAFVFRPALDFAGVDTFTIQASDGAATSAPSLVTVVVQPVNDPPRITQTTLQVVAGQTGATTLQAIDPEGQPLFFLVTVEPAFGAVELNAVTGDIEYTPDAGYVGPDLVEFSVSDGNLSAFGFLPVVVSTDDDGDAIANALDNCPTVANADQSDVDGNGRGDLCDCVSESFSATIDPAFVGASAQATPVDTRFVSPGHALRLGGAGAFIETTPQVGCDNYFYELQVANGTPAPEASDLLRVSVSRNGGAFELLTEVAGAGATSPFGVIRGSTGALNVSGNDIRFRFEVIADQPDDLFLIDDVFLGCDTDADLLPDCIEATLPGYDLTEADADNDGLIDSEEFARRTDPNFPDTDFDGVDDGDDNCPNVFNPPLPNGVQPDADGNGFGDACDKAIIEDFASGQADPGVWVSQPTGEAAISNLYAFNDSNSLRLGEDGGELESAPIDLFQCTTVAWDFRFRTGAGVEIPASNDIFRLEGWDAAANDWFTLFERAGNGTVIDWTVIVGTTQDPRILTDGARLRFMTVDSGSVNQDAFYIDDIVIGCDKDGDGLPNFKEIRTYRSSVDLVDTDGDGVSDRDEVIAGTDPTRFPPIDLPVVDNFATGAVDATAWLSGPTDDAEVSMDFANSGGASSDLFSLRLGDNGGELVSVDIDFAACPRIAWDFRLRTGDGFEMPEATDSFRFDVFDRNLMAFQKVVERFGGTPIDFETNGKIIGVSDSTRFRTPNGTQIRFFTPDTGNGVDSDSWYVDEFYIDCDLDNDKLPDNKEVAYYGTDPTVADADGDGVVDGDEVLQGTDPAFTPFDPEFEDAFATGAVDLSIWEAQPIGDAEVSSTFSLSDGNALRLGDNGGSLTSLEHGFNQCTAVAWDLRVKSGEGAEAPETGDPLQVQVYNRFTATWITIDTIAGGTAYDFDPILGSSDNAAFAFGTRVRLNTPNTGNGIDSDSWYIDDVAFGCDEDQDLIPDFLEGPKYGTDPNNADSDGDGVLDGDEVMLGTNAGLSIVDDFGVGTADEIYWDAQPTGDAEISSLLANGDTYSLRIGDNGGELVSADVNFGACGSPVAWDFRIATASAPDEPEATDQFDIEVWDPVSTSYVNVESIAGGATYNFDIVLGNSNDPAFSGLTHLRLVTPDTSGGTDADSFFIDDVAIGCDQDNDLIPDIVELERYGTDPTRPDTDFDGVIDGEEVLAGTDPAGPIGLVPDLFWYVFDGTGTTVPNLATNPPTGTSTGTLTGLTQGTPGICLGGGSLIGTGGSSTTNRLNTGWATNLTGSWTISFWTENIAASSTLWYILGDSNAGNLRVFTNGVAGANNWMIRGPLTDVTVTGTATLSANMTTFVYDASLGNIVGYANGSPVTTVNQTFTSITGTGPFTVGAQGANTGLSSGGRMDDVRIYNRALSATEVSALYSLCP